MSTTRFFFDGLWRGKRKCIKPKAGDADLWTKIWEELHLSRSKEILVDVQHFKAHRTKKGKKEMSTFEKFVAVGNEKADELAKAGAMLDEGFTADKDSPTRKRGSLCGLAVRGQLSLLGGGMERL